MVWSWFVLDLALCWSSSCFGLGPVSVFSGVTPDQSPTCSVLSSFRSSVSGRVAGLVLFWCRSGLGPGLDFGDGFRVGLVLVCGLVSVWSGLWSRFGLVVVLGSLWG